MVNPNISRRDFLKLAGVTSGGLALTACGLDPTKFPDPTATAAAEALSTGSPPEFPIPLEVISTTEPIPGHPSVVDGLNIGEVTPNNVVGMIPGYESTGINTLYNPNDPSMLITKQNGEQVEAIPPRAFGIDQDQLIQYFNAKEVEGGEIMGDYQGASLTLKNGIWKAATGETFIPFIKAEPNTDAIYLVMDANGQLQKVDITGKAVGSPMPMFETPQAIAARMGFEKANDVVDVEMNKNGSLSFITKEARPSDGKLVQYVNEVSFLGEPEDLSKNEMIVKVADSIISNLATIGINISPSEPIKTGIKIQRIQGNDPKDPDKAKKINFNIYLGNVKDRGDYPLIIANSESGQLVEACTAQYANLCGKEISAPIYSQQLAKGELAYKEAFLETANMAIIANELDNKTVFKRFKQSDWKKILENWDSVKKQLNNGEIPTGLPFDFSGAQVITEFCKSNNIPIRSQHLLWGEDIVPTIQEGNFTPDELSKILEFTVKSRVTEFKGLIREWSVDEIASSKLWGGEKQKFWYEKLNDYSVVLDVVKWAKEVDPSIKVVVAEDNVLESTYLPQWTDEFFKLLGFLKSNQADIWGVDLENNFWVHDPPSKDVIKERLGAIKDMGFELATPETTVFASSPWYLYDKRPSKVNPSNIEAAQAQIMYDIATAYFEAGADFGVGGIGDRKDISWIASMYGNMNAAAMPLDEKFNKKMLYHEILRAMNATFV